MLYLYWVLYQEYLNIWNLNNSFVLTELLPIPDWLDWKIPYIYIYCPNVIEGYLKAHFSIAATPRCWGGRYFFPWITPLTRDPFLIMLNVKLRAIMYHFLSFWYDLTLDWTSAPPTIGDNLTITPMGRSNETFGLIGFYLKKFSNSVSKKKNYSK